MIADRARVLWVTAEPPDHHLGGGNKRQAHLIGALAARADVHLLLAGELQDERVRAAAAEVTEVRVAPARPVPHWRRRVHQLRWVALGGEPEEIRDHGSARAALAAPLRALERSVDLVTLEHTGLSPLIAHRSSAPWAIDLQQLGSERALHALALPNSRRVRMLLRTERRRVARLEACLVDRFDEVFVTSPEDASVLPGRAVVVPNGVDTTMFTASPLAMAQRVVLTATLDYLPNVDGIIWFCEQIVPRVRVALPSATFAVVGRHPTTSVVTATGRAGVDLHANVPSVAEHLEAARVAVVPLRIGSGTRLKALEAMATGRAVVGTGIGLAGLGVSDGVQALVADDAASFAHAVVRCLSDDDLARSLGWEGRKHVERNFTWAAIGEQYADAVVRLIGPVLR